MRITETDSNSANSTLELEFSVSDPMSARLQKIDVSQPQLSKLDTFWSDVDRQGRISISSPLTIFMQNGERHGLRHGAPFGERKTKEKTGKQGKTRPKQPQKPGYF